MSDQFKIEWHDTGREPKAPPNPRYPNGIDLDISSGSVEACEVDLPYPARRGGFYDVECNLCGAQVAVTTAGRADDPRTVIMSCWARKLK